MSFELNSTSCRLYKNFLHSMKIKRNWFRDLLIRKFVIQTRLLSFQLRDMPTRGPCFGERCGESGDPTARFEVSALGRMTMESALDEGWYIARITMIKVGNSFLSPKALKQ